MPWAESGVGPFSPMYVNDGLTLDFDDASEPFPVLHYCFRVGQAEFDNILGRIRDAGIAYRVSQHAAWPGRPSDQHRAWRQHRLLE